MNEGSQTEEVAALQAELARVRADADALREMLEERRAEFRNYKRRIEAERAAERAAANRDLIERLLPLLDDLRRGLAGREPLDAWSQGIAQIVRKFEGILEREGLRRMEPLGAAFDPNLHEAVAEVETDRVPEGHVAGVARDGYWLDERVLRPAQVVVAKKPVGRLQRPTPAPHPSAAGETPALPGRASARAFDPYFDNEFINPWRMGGRRWPR